MNHWLKWSDENQHEKSVIGTEVSSIQTEHLAPIYINKSVHILPIWDTMRERTVFTVDFEFALLNTQRTIEKPPPFL